MTYGEFQEPFAICRVQEPFAIWYGIFRKIKNLISHHVAQLGAASRVSFLNDETLVLITHEVLGGRSLVKLWQRERLAHDGEAV